jgi:hypothetical protein
MTCPNCGSQQPAGARFCDQCGTPLDQSQPAAANSAPVAAAPAVAAPVAQAAPSGGLICPVCGAANIPGEVFCENCGASLVGTPPTPVSAGVATPMPAASTVPATPAPVVQAASAPMAAAAVPVATPQPVPMTMPPRPRLVVVEGGSEIPLPPRDVVYIGREDAVSNSFPDIDTTPFGGMDKGVSRRHAAIHHQANDGYILEDLGSVNGSYINRDRLDANEKRNLLPGDTINLGRLAIRFEV